MANILSESDLSNISSEIRGILGDGSISTTVTFYLSGTTVDDWSPTSQLIPAMYTTSAVSSFRGSFTRREIEESDGLIEYGDVKFIMMADDVSGILTIIDKIYESGTTWASAATYELKDIVRDPLNLCYFFQARFV